jgi:hypothetical protein
MKYLYLISLIVLFASCVKDKPQEPVKTAVTVSSDKRVFIINEGNYGWANASISLFDPSSNNVIEDYYKQQNSNVGIGDVCQSITKYNNKYYIVVNNSNKIIVTNASDFSKTAIINGFNSPRYILPITFNKAYVSDLYANSIQIVNLNTNTITGSIPCSGWTEKMALIYNKAFVTNINSDYCYIINTTNDIITDSINIGKGASSILIDKNAKVWILSSGNSSSSIPGKLLRIDPVTLLIEQNLIFNLSDTPKELCINKTLDTLYYLNKGICQFPLNNSSLPLTAIINQGTKLYYGLGINPKDYSIYVSDAIDYVQKSKIEIYTTTGSLKSSFNAGINSNGFIFE